MVLQLLQEVIDNSSKWYIYIYIVEYKGAGCIRLKREFELILKLVLNTKLQISNGLNYYKLSHQ